MKLTDLKEATYRKPDREPERIASIRVYTGEEEGGWVGVDINDISLDTAEEDYQVRETFDQVSLEKGIKNLLNASEDINGNFLQGYNPDEDLWNEDPEGNPPTAYVDNNDIKQFVKKIRELNLHDTYYAGNDHWAHDKYFPSAILVAL